MGIWLDFSILPVKTTNRPKPVMAIAETVAAQNGKMLNWICPKQLAKQGMNELNEIRVLKAAHFAALKHKDQRRKDHNASPYINHPIAVALIIAEVGRVDNPDVLAAALLHDTIEDTDTTSDELEREFGTPIRTLVEEVTDDTRLPSKERKKLQIEHAADLSADAVLIKLGDKIANVTDMIKAPPVGWNSTRRHEYLDWAEAVIANCPKVNAKLESQFNQVLERARNSLR